MDGLKQIMYVAHGPYLVPHEGECGHGFVDIALKPQLSRYPEIGYAAQIELKYFKAKDEVTPETLAKVRADALAQLDRYARDKDIARSSSVRKYRGSS